MFSFWILHGFSNNILPCSLIIQLLRLLPSLQSISFYFRFEVANIILPCLKASPHESDVDDQGDMGGTNPDPAIYNSSLAFPVNAFDQCVYMGCLAYMDTRVLLVVTMESQDLSRRLPILCSGGFFNACVLFVCPPELHCPFPSSIEVNFGLKLSL
ncbi:hypothetical protein RB195_016967 [Necator americanus]|uniref:Uncharacterized protein n=1 Tax=Necator americanus TaxID=51031 RepID=A0ABR1C2Z0_NECAM